MKDIWKFDCDILIDDDTEEIKITEYMGKIGILIEPYRKNKKMDVWELRGIIVRYQL
jgi:hypothetical protein